MKHRLFYHVFTAFMAITHFSTFVGCQDLLAQGENILLDNHTILENLPAGTEIGTITKREDQTLTVVDSSPFTIQNNHLASTQPFNFEEKSSYSTQIQVEDTAGNTEIYNFIITVLDANDPPIILAQDEIVIEQGNSLLLTLENFTVEDEDASSNFPEDFSLTIQSGTNYALENNLLTPAQGFSGQLMVPLFVNDGIDNSEVFTATITVNEPANLPPTADAGQDQTLVDDDRDGLASVNLDASASSDEDGSILTYEWDWDGGDATGQTVSVDLPIGTTRLTLTVTDNQGATDTDAVSINIEAAEILPPAFVLLTDQLLLEEDFSKTSIRLIPDENTPDATYSMEEGQVDFAQLNIDPDDGEITISPLAHQHGGPELIAITATDKQDASNTFSASFSLEVSPVNDIPQVVTPLNDFVVSTASTDTSFDISGVFTDIEDGSNLNITAQSNPSSLALARIQGSTLNIDFNDRAGIVTIMLTASDQSGGQAENSFDIEIIEEQKTPFFSLVSDLFEAAEDFTQDIVVEVQPEDATQEVTYAISPQSVDFATLTADNNNGVYVFASKKDKNGRNDFTITATNAQLNTHQESFSVRVNAVNDAPIFSISQESISVENDNKPVHYDAFFTGISPGPQSATDEENQSLEFELKAAQPSFFSKQPEVDSNGKLSFTPAPDAVGTTDVEITLLDGGSGQGNNVNSRVENLSIQLTKKEVLPPDFSISRSILNLQEDFSGTEEISIIDPPDVPVTYSLDPTASSVTVADVDIDNSSGTVSIRSITDANGSASMRIIATDLNDASNSSSQSFGLTVNPVNDEPSFILGGNPPAVEVDAGRQDIVNFVSDVQDGDPELEQTLNFFLSQTQGELAFADDVSVNSDGTLIYQAAAGESGIATFEIFLQDDASANNRSDVATFTITVNEPANLPPTADAGEDQTLVDDDRDGLASVNLDAAASSDDDGSILTYKWDWEGGDATGQTVSVDLPTGTTRLTLTVTDDQGATDTDAVNVTVNEPANLPPTADASQTNQNVVDDNNDGAEAILLDARASSDDRGIVSYQWTWDTGSATGETSTQNFAVGVHELTLVTEDEDGLTDTDIITITVNAGAIPAPSFTLDQSQLILDEDFSSTVFITLTPDEGTPAAGYSFNSPTVTFANLSINEANGRVSIRALPNAFGGPVNISILATDKSDASNIFSDEYTLIVNAVNDPPVVDNAPSDFSVTTEQGDTTLNISEVFIDVEDNQLLNFSASSDNNALIQQSIDGSNLTLTFNGTPGTATISLTAEDSQGLQAQTSFVVEIVEESKTPFFDLVNNIFEADEDFSNTVAIAAQPQDLTQEVSYEIAPASIDFATLTADNSDGVYTFLSKTDRNGEQRFTITATNTQGNQFSRDFTFRVNPINDRPIFNLSQSAVTVEEGETLHQLSAFATDIAPGPSSAVDEQNQAMAFELLADDPAMFKEQPSLSLSGALAFTPANNKSGSTNVEVSLIDLVDQAAGLRRRRTRSFAININEAANALPVATSANYSLDEDTNQPITLSGSDADGNSLTFAVATTPTNGTLVKDGTDILLANTALTGSSITYVPNTNFFGSDSFTFTANDGVDNSAPALIELTVNAVNDAPAVNNPIADFSVEENSSGRSIDIGNTFSDVDDTDLNVSASSSNPGLVSTSLSNNGQTLTLNFSNGQSGTADVTVTGTDGANAFAETVFTVTIAANQAPTANAGSNQNLTDTDGNGSETVSLSGSASDSDGTITDFDWSWNTGNASGKNVDITLPLGTTVVTLTVTDNDGATGQDNVNITVQDQVAPEFSVSPDDIVVDEDFSANRIVEIQAEPSTPSATYSFDPALSSLSFVNASYNAISQQISIEPVTHASGSANVVITATDVNDNSNTTNKSFNITVNPVNDAPVITGQSPNSLQTNEETALQISLNNLQVTDPDHSFPTDFTLSVRDGSNYNRSGNTITPAANYSGILTVPLTVSDGSANSNVFDLKVNVNATNDAPVAEDVTLSTDEETVVTISFSATDADGDNLSYTIENSPGNGTLGSITGNQVVYTPETNFSGTDSFTYRSSDGTATSNQATVTITVNDKNDSPVASDIITDTEEDTSTEIELVATDAENDALTFAIVDSPQNGTLGSISGANVTYTPEANFFGSDSFSFRATDSNGGTSNLGQVFITINSVNDAPTASNANISTDEDQAVTVVMNASDMDEDALTFNIVETPGNGSLGSVNGNQVTYTPANNFTGEDTFRFRANDGKGGVSNLAKVTVTVNNINDLPQAQNKSVSTNEESPLNIVLVANDPDGEPLTYSVENPPENGTLSGISGNQLTYTPESDFFGNDAFTFKAEDPSDGISSPATVSITVINVNDAPTATDVTTSTQENQAADITLTADDPDNESLTYEIVDNPVSGTLTSLSGDQVTYTPNPNFFGTDSFTFKATDPNGSESNESTVTVSVSNVNDAPVASDFDVTTSEEVARSITLTASDPDGQPLTYSIVSNPQHGSLGAISGNRLVYTPNLNYAGADSFTFKASDGDLESNTATVSVTVTNINDAPVVANPIANQSVNENSDALTINIANTFTDVDHSSLTIIASSDNEALVSTEVSANQNTLSLNFGSGQSGTANISVRAVDGSGGSTTDVFSVTVIANQAPTANAGDDQSLIDTDGSGNEPIALRGTGTDADGTIVNYLWSWNGGTATGPDVNITLPLGTSEVVLTVTDDDGATATDIIAVTVNAPESPTFSLSPSSLIVNEEFTNTQMVEVVPDPGKPKAIYSFSPALNTISLVSVSFSEVSKELSFSSVPNAQGNTNITITATDVNNAANTATQNLSITVTNINDAPQIIGQRPNPLQTPEETPITINLNNLNVSDPDNSFPQDFTLNVADGNNYSRDGNIITPNPDFSGLLSIPVTVNDGTFNSDVFNLQVQVDNTNDIPTVFDVNTSTSEESPVTITLDGIDIDGDLLTYTKVSLPDHGSLGNITGNEVVYTPNPNFSGQDSFTYQASDGNNATSNTATVTVDVTNINDAPIAQPVSISTDEDSPVTVNMDATDPDADPLTFLIVNPPANGSLGAITDKRVVYTPNNNFSGNDFFTYKASDGQLESNTDTVFLNVSNTNDAPLATPFSISVNEDQTLTITLNGTDPDGDPLNFTKASDPAHGILSPISEGILTYRPDPDFNGIDSFTYTVNDGSLTSTPAQVDITVLSVNDPPQATDIPAITANEDDPPVQIDLSTYFSDVDNATLSYSVAQNTNESLVSTNIVSSTLAVSFLPDAAGSGSLAIRATDAAGDFAEKVISIAVSAVNDAPQITNTVNQVMEEDSQFTIPFSAFQVVDPDDTYPEGFIIKLQPGDNYTLANNNAAVVPTPNFFGSLNVNALVNDGDKNSNPVVLRVDVSNVNDAPVLSLGESERTAPINYERNDPPVQITNTLTVSDIDGNILTSAVVAFSQGAQGSFFYNAGEDLLEYKKTGNIVGTWDEVQGTLTLNGNANEDTYRDALRNIKYKNLKPANPTSIPRQLVFSVSDGVSPSENLIRFISVDNSNVPPKLSSFQQQAVEDNNLTLNASVFADNFQDDIDPFNNVIYITQLPKNGSLIYNGQTVNENDLSPQTGGFKANLNEGNQLTYIPNDNFNGKDQFNWLALDSDIQEGDLSNSAVVSINIIEVADAPDISAPTSIDAFEDESFAFTETRTLSFDDPDSDADSLTVTLQVNQGLLSFTNQDVVSSLIFLLGDGTEESQMSFRGTEADINNAMLGLRYQSQTNFSGTDLLSITAIDPQQNQNSLSVAINVSAVNDTPILTITSTDTLQYVENRAGIPLINEVTIADQDNDNISSAMVTIVENFTEGQDSLLFIPTPGISGSYLENSLMLSGEASIVAYTEALKNIRYINNSENPDTLVKRVDFQISDTENGSSNSASVYLQIEAIDDPLMLVGLESTVLNWLPGNEPKAISQTLSIVDVDNDSLTSAVISFTDDTYRLGQDSLLFNHEHLESQWFEQQGQLRIRGISSLDIYQEALKSVAYTNRAEAPNSGERQLLLQVFRFAEDSSSALRVIHVQINKMPLLSDLFIEVPVSIPFHFNQQDFLSNFSDPDGFPSDSGFVILNITQLPVHGELLLGDSILSDSTLQAGGIALEPGQLDSLTYQPDADYTGTDSLLWNAFDGESYSAEDALVNIRIFGLSAIADEDTEVCIGDPISLGVTVEGGSNNFTYDWSCDRGDCGISTPDEPEITVRPVRTTTYYVTVTDGSGLISSSDTVIVKGLDCYNLELDIPTAFTPNGDGANDTWVINNLDTYRDQVVRIYDRNGKEVYYSEGYNRPWEGTLNGRLLPAGTYYYYIELNAGEAFYRGSVSILK